MQISLNWARIFNRLFPLINQMGGENYYSGPRFLEAVREVDPFYLSYSQLMEERKKAGRSTTRKDFFYDVLMGFSEGDRLRLLEALIRPLEHSVPDGVAAIRAELAAHSPVPTAVVPTDLWNGERLNDYLREIDARISKGNFEGAITLCYSSLEGL